MACPALLFASPITVLPVLGASAELTSEVPDGLTISVTAISDPFVDVSNPVSPFFGFIQFSLAGEITESATVTFQTAFEFGEGVGAVSFEDDFNLNPIPALPGVGAQFVYLNCDCAVFEFGLAGEALIGQPGAFDIFQFVPIAGDTITVPYRLSLLSFDVPLPPAVWLLGSGVLALFGSKRLRR